MKNNINKRAFSILMLLCLFISAFLPIGYVLASETNEEITHVFDKAELLSTSEVAELEEMCIEYGETAGIEIILLTHDDPNALYAEDYIEDFEDLLPVADRVYTLVDMNEGMVFMEGYGLAETYIHSKRIDVITDEMLPYLQDGKFYDAFVVSIKRSAEYMKDDSELNYDHDYTAGTPQNSNPNADYYDETWPSDYDSSDDSLSNFLSNVFVQLVAALIIGLISVVIMAYNSGGRMTTGGNTYMDPNHSGLIGRRDDYIRTTVTKIRKPQNNNTGHNNGGFNAGGFRGGISGGGRSHSSGGKRF
jgi:uncharacterized protein